MPTIDVKTLEIRPVRAGDVSEIVRIDATHAGRRREAYYQALLERYLDASHHTTLSFVACRDGRVLGFLIGEVSRGAYGLPEEVATVQTVGVDRAYARSGIAAMLFAEFETHARRLGVERVYTLVSWSDPILGYFHRMGFHPAQTLYLERTLPAP